MLVEDTHYEDYIEDEELEEINEIKSKEVNTEIIQPRKPLKLTVLFIILFIILISAITIFGLQRYIYKNKMNEPLKVGDTRGPN